ncbi:hypothetical protein PIB30_080162 [Stylosanthes scabra]|uniref:Uncharacterized protein n=1 Tax=Stylosanthes scabra TaxID=79078 RepID=A0ABU6QS78_9FABA|nr:hypothetical protein [Stylosanthes scabra]
MGRQDNDPTIVNSSIALLQERFRQLEKVKEKREGKELLKLLSSSSETHDPRGAFSSAQNQQASSQRNNSTLQPRLMVPSHSRPGFHDDSLSLGLNLNSKQGYYDHNYTMKSSSPSSSSSSSYSLWSSPQGASSSSRNFDSSDVDTSLHL